VRTASWRLLPSLALLAVVAMAGCSSRAKLAEVTGKVTLKGAPLPRVMVEFIPDGPTGPRASGTTDENGQYTLTCDDQRKGAMVGPNRVVLHDLDVMGDKFLGRKMEQIGTKDGPTLKPSRIPEHFADVARTPLKKEVKPEPNTIDLDLSAR
jgi:hypothetical protein